MTTQQENPQTRKFGLSNILLILGLSVLLCGEAYFGYHVHALSSEQKQIKEDYAMSNNITFGLFSVDEWRDRIAAVVNGQVSDFSMTSAQKKALQRQIEQALHALVTKTVTQFNKPQKSLVGKLKRFAFNSMVNADDIQAQVPSFAKTIVDKVSSPASTNRLKNIATSKINQLENQTYDNTSDAYNEVTKYLYVKYHVSDSVAYHKQIKTKLSVIHKVMYDDAFAMMGCVLLALVLWWLMRNQVNLQATLFVMSLMFAGVLLMVGITSSIIEVDARLQSLNFMLMGQKVAFDNQVLFFQSKSILGIVEVLLKQSKPDAIVVGSLIFIFIILLPVVRLIAKCIHILSPKRIAENKVVNYLAFQSAKWDMSDVMIVGILMTYIGLNGILKSQLTNLNIHNSFLTTETVNYTSLQPGYFIFAGYVIFATVLSYILKRITPYDAK